MNSHFKAYARTWRPVTPLPKNGGKLGRRLRVAAVLAALFAVSGAIIAWLLYYQPLPQAHFLPLCMGEYGEDFPIRGWVRQDGEALRGLRWKETNAFTNQQRALVQQELRRLAGHTFKGPLVVYVNAYARTTPEGELFLLPVDAHLEQPATWLPLREIFKQLRDAKARHTLLLLDIMQPFTDVRHGLLVNDAAERVQPLLEEAVANDPRLSVLCACSPGQVSIVAEELGHSVFAYFLWKGLRGQADGENARHRPNDRVSLPELAEYVTAQVDGWTQRNRGVRQTPRLYGCGDDYPLIAMDSSAAAEEEPPLPAEYPDWLSAGWKQRDHWLAEENFRLETPLLTSRAAWETALLRAERQWRGGIPTDRVRQDLTPRQTRLEHQRSALQPPAAAMTPPSLARATAGGRQLPDLSDDKTIEAVARLAARYARAKEGKPDPETLNKLNAEREQLLKKFEGKPLALAWVVFAATERDIPLPAALGFLSGLLAQAQAPELVETRLLARLAELPAATADDRSAAVSLALRTMWEAEKYACGSSRALPWLQEVHTGVDRLRREGETLLFAKDAASHRRAADLLHDAHKAYLALNRDRDAVEDAQRWGEEMPLQLASYVPYLEVDASTEPAWKNAVTTTGTLRQMLAVPAAQPGEARDAKIRRLLELTATLRNDRDNLNSLRRPLNRQPFEQLIGRSRAGDVADGKVMTALLETPWPGAEQRAKLWSARRELLDVLQAKRTETSRGAWNESQAIEAERRRGLARAQRALAVLRLMGSEKVKKVEAALAQAEARTADTGRLRAVAEALRQAW